MHLKNALPPALLAGCALALAASPALSQMPPVAAVLNVPEVFHGVTVDDPYRHLENLRDPQTSLWLKGQGEHAAAQLARIAGRDAMQARIAEIAQASGDMVRGIVRMPGERTYYLKRAAGASQFKLMLRRGASGAERLLVDPEVLAKGTGVPHAIDYFSPSWDGRTLAYGVSAAGSEDASLHLLDLRSGKAIGRPIARVAEPQVSWAPDSKSLTYNQTRVPAAGAADSEKYMDTTVFHLRIDRPGAVPRALFGPLVNPGLKLDRLDVASVVFDPGSRFMIARTTDTTVPEGKLFVAPVASLNAKAIAWRQFAAFSDKITEVALRKDTVYLRTYADAPRGRVVALDLSTPDLKRALPVVAEPNTGVLTGFNLGRDALYAEVREGFNTRVLRHATGKLEGIDATPGLAGSTFNVADAAHAYGDAFVSTGAWTAPSRVLRTSADGSTTDTGLRRDSALPELPALEVREVKVAGHDGAMIPMAIVHKAGLVPDGTHPTLLIGYGSYGFSFNASYDTRNLAWIERGGVIAYANVRGSGAYGDAWYRAGFKATKPNTWKDGIACAQWLIEQKYASPKTLSVWGTSAGGIFAGRSVTAAPQLFSAAIFDVGVMDAVRAEDSANGVTNISEFGTVKDPQEFKALLEMSPYHHIKGEVAYPAVLLVHGLNDPRVDVWHSAKAAARLQAATTSGRPVLLRLDAQAGHGMGSTAQQGFSQRADIFSFLLWQAGKVQAGP